MQKWVKKEGKCKFPEGSISASRSDCVVLYSLQKHDSGAKVSVKCFAGC